MSGIYTVTFAGVAVTAQQDLMALVAHSSKQCVLLGFGISQSTEVGDTAEEGLRNIGGIWWRCVHASSNGRGRRCIRFYLPH